MMELSKRNLWRCIYGVFAIMLFILGFFLPQILSEEIRLDLNIKEEYSLFSGLSLAGYLLTVAMSIDSATIERKGKFDYRTVVAVSVILLWAQAVILHPLSLFHLTKLLPIEWFSYMESYERIFPAFLMSIAGMNVFFLGFDTKGVTDNEKKMQIIRFLILGITLISLISIAVAFTLSTVGLSMSGSDRRAMIFGSNLFIPIAAYALGYLAKLIGRRIVRWIGMFLSLIISFLLSMILYTLMEANIFVCPASISIFLVVGLLLKLLEEEPLSV